MKKKIFTDMSILEKRLLGLLPIVVMVAMILYGVNWGWDELTSEFYLYIILGVAAIGAYFLLKGSTLMLGRFHISLMGHSSFEGVPKKTLLLRNQIGMYSSVVGAAAAFVWGIFHMADLVVIFSWSLFGITTASRQLIEEILETK